MRATTKTIEAVGDYRAAARTLSTKVVPYGGGFGGVTEALMRRHVARDADRIHIAHARRARDGGRGRLSTQ